MATYKCLKTFKFGIGCHMATHKCTKKISFFYNLYFKNEILDVGCIFHDYYLIWYYKIWQPWLHNLLRMWSFIHDYNHENDMEWHKQLQLLLQLDDISNESKLTM